MITQLNPALPLDTPKGAALCHFIIDYGMESDLYWVCFLDYNGECWTFSNKEIRAQKNITLGRSNELDRLNEAIKQHRAETNIALREARESAKESKLPKKPLC